MKLSFKFSLFIFFRDAIIFPLLFDISVSYTEKFAALVRLCRGLEFLLY